MATHSSVLTWRIWGTGEPGGLPSMGSHRVGHDWSSLAAAATIYSLTYSFSHLEPVCCSMSSSDCCSLTCIQISQEAGKVVWYSHLFKNFPQFVVIHTDFRERRDQQISQNHLRLCLAQGRIAYGDVIKCLGTTLDWVVRQRLSEEVTYNWELNKSSQLYEDLRGKNILDRGQSSC